MFDTLEIEFIRNNLHMNSEALANLMTKVLGRPITGKDIRVAREKLNIINETRGKSKLASKEKLLKRAKPLVCQFRRRDLIIPWHTPIWFEAVQNLLCAPVTKVVHGLAGEVITQALEEAKTGCIRYDNPRNWRRKRLEQLKRERGEVVGGFYVLAPVEAGIEVTLVPDSR